MHYLMNMDCEIMVMRLNLGLYHSNHIIHEVGKIEILIDKRKLTAFDTRHVKHFIDKTQKMAARRGNLAKTFHNALTVVDVCARDGCHADNCVHRRSYVMRHI